jgi:hypothetical protein
MSRKLPLFALLFAMVFMVCGQAKADVLYLTGFGASTDLPLTATVTIDSVSAYEIKVTITNTSIDAGDDNRITYFGIQVPNDTVVGDIVDAETDGDWKIETDSKLPGNGADEFEFLQTLVSMGGQPGLKLGETLTILYTSTDPIFDPLDIFSWELTDKNEYLAAAKFQSVGDNDNDSGVAGVTVPEPASAALMLLGLGMLMSRSRRTNRV